MLVSKNFDPKCVGNFLKKLVIYFFFGENFETETCWKSCWIFSWKFWYSYQNLCFSRWSYLVFWKIDKNLVGFSYEDLGKFSKSLSFFLKIFDLKLVEEFSFENFDILTKICICENMWGILEMIMSFGNLIKTLLGFAKKELWIFRKSCWTIWELLLWLSKKLCQP